jgi:MarR family transcriptional regulator, lower aerobic nicotinate degradation pathway regulator
MPTKTTPSLLPLTDLPGHYIRRLQQIAVGVFMEETQAFGVTPVQFAALNALVATPGIDQRTLAASIGFDTSTIGGVVDRLEARGWVQRQVSPEDRRARLLRLTPEGTQLLQEVSAAVQSTQQRILAPLPESERQEFLRMLKVLVATNNDASRAPRLVD